MSKTNAYVYDVLRIIDGKILFFPDHYERLVQSLTSVNSPTIPSRQEVFDAIMTFVQEQHIENNNVKLIYEDGISLISLKPAYPSQQQYKDGVDCELMEARRTNPQAKVNNQSLRDAADAFIAEKKIYEAILVSQGVISEGSRSTIFFVKGDSVYTAPLEGVLPGITRKHIVQVCGEQNIPVVEEKILAERLGEYEAAFIGGTSPKVLPIRRIGEFTYDVDHPTLRKLMKAFDAHIA